MAEIIESRIPLPGSASGFSAPLVADIDGNLANGLEIVKATSDGVVHAVNSSGALLWSTAIPSIGCVGAVGNRVHSSPAIGTLNNSGDKSIVIGFGAVVSRSCDGGVVALNARTGTLEWKFSLKDFSKKEKFWAFRYSVFSTPALADVTGDGLAEVSFGAFDRNQYLLNNDGKARWYYLAADTIWSSPAFTNISGDARPELVVATDISANKRLKPATPDGGYLYAMRTDQRRPLRVNFRDSKNAFWRNETDQVLYSSPVVADVMANPGKEIIIASGCFFPQRTSQKRGRWIKIFDEDTGNLLQTLPTPTCSASSIAVGDLDDDGQLEVIGYIQGAARNGGPGPSHVMAWKADSAQVLWDVVPYNGGSNQELGGEYSTPVVGDINGDGSLEVLVGNDSGVTVLDGKTGAQLTCAERNCSDKPSLITSGGVASAPALADINGDGSLEVVAAASGGIYVWSGFAGTLASNPGAQAAYSAPWPTWRGNFSRTGSFGPESNKAVRKRRK